MNNKKKIYIGLIALLIIAVIVVAAVLFITQYQNNDLCDGPDCSEPRYDLARIRGELSEEAAHRKSCSSEECVLSAARMLKLMDKNVEPCEDFYGYACGNFPLSHTIPGKKLWYTSQDAAVEEIDLTIKNILQEPINANDSASLEDTKLFYRSCMNQGYIEKNAADELKQLLSSTGIGEWPFLNPDWKDCRPDLEWRMAKLNALGVESLISFDTFINMKERNLIARITTARPIVADICQEKKDNLTLILEKAAEQREVLQSVLELLGVEITNTTDDDMDDLFEFDYNFCVATSKCEDIDAVPWKLLSPENVTLLKLGEIAPQINWIRWRNLIFSEIRLNLPHEKLNVYVHDLENCIQDITNLVSNTSSKVLANYLTWKFVFEHIKFMSKPYRQIFEDHPASFSSPSFPSLDQNPDFFSWTPRWKQCTGYIKEHMPMTILKSFYEITMENDTIKAMTDIVSRIKNEFRTVMKHSRLLSETERIKSYHKIDTIPVRLIYPYQEDKFFDIYYSGMGRMSESFFKNVLKLKHLRLQKLLEGVWKSKTPLLSVDYLIEGRRSPFTWSPITSFYANRISISLVELKSQSIKPTVPKYKTLATFGFTMGHELAQGFDLSAFIVPGKNWTKWPNYVYKQVTRRALCYLDGEIPSDDRMLSLNTILNGDLRDSQGLYLAFMAYVNYLNNHGDDEFFPGLPLSNAKLFFLSFAQQFCELRIQDDTSVRTGRSMVNKAVKNFPAFSDAFHCARGTAMNPSKKCDVLWH